MVGTKAIILKYQKLLYKEQAPDSESSDEPFQFNLPEAKEKRLKKKRRREAR